VTPYIYIKNIVRFIYITLDQLLTTATPVFLALLDISVRAFAVSLPRRMDAFRSVQHLKVSTRIVGHPVLRVLLFETNNTKCTYVF